MVPLVEYVVDNVAVTDGEIVKVPVALTVAVGDLVSVGETDVVGVRERVSRVADSCCDSVWLREVEGVTVKVGENVTDGVAVCSKLMVADVEKEFDGVKVSESETDSVCDGVNVPLLVGDALEVGDRE